jgi:hypothetical protein
MLCLLTESPMNLSLWDMLMQTLRVVIQENPRQVTFSLLLEELYRRKGPNKL